MELKRINTDFELINQCLGNNRISQKKLYDMYKDKMFTLAYRISGNFDDASDILQDGFVQIFRDLKNFEGRSTIGAWIKTIIIRTAIKNIKKNYQTERLDDISYDEAIDWDDDLKGQDLEKAMLKISSGYRTIFTLIEIEGYSHKEVSEMLGISVGTSKSQLFHSKKALQKELVHFANDYK